MDELAQVPPSPINEEESILFEDKESSSRLPKRTNHKAKWPLYVAQAQKYSAYTFATFLGIHATTVGLVPLLDGVDAGDKALVLARVLYQSPFVEPVMIWGALGVHIASGVGLRIYRMSQFHDWYGSAVYAITKMSQTSIAGYMVAPLVLTHALLTRIIPWRYDGDSADVGLRLISHGFARHVALSRAFYTLLVVIGGFHVTTGLARFLRLRNKKLRAFVIAAGAIGAAWLSSVLFVTGRAGLARVNKYDRWYRMIWGGF